MDTKHLVTYTLHIACQQISIIFSTNDRLTTGLVTNDVIKDWNRLSWLYVHVWRKVDRFATQFVHLPTCYNLYSTNFLLPT